MKQFSKIFVLFLCVYGASPQNSFGRQDFNSVDSIFLLHEMLEHENDLALRAKIYFKIGFKYHREIQQYDSAESHYRKSEQIYQQLADTFNLGLIKYRIGAIDYNRNRMSQAIKYCHEAISYFKIVGRLDWEANSMNLIGNVYNYIGEHKTAIEYYSSAEEVFESIDDVMGLGMIYSNLAIIYGEEGLYEKSQEYNFKSLDISESNNDERGIMLLLGNIGLTYKDMGELNKSIEYLNKMLDLSLNSNSVLEQAAAYKNLGIVYCGLTDYHRAISYSLHALELADEIGDELVKVNAVATLATSYEALGEYNRAIKYLKMSNVIDSTLYNQENSQIRHELQARYEVEKKEKENEILRRKDEINKAEIEQQQLINYFVIGGLAFLLLFSLILYITNRKINRHKGQIQKQANKLKQLDEYKSRFFANISHDIRTPLTLISGYAHQVKTDDSNYLTERSLQNLAKLERNSQKLNDMAEEIRDLILLEEGNLKLCYTKVRIDSYLSLLVNMFSSAAEIRMTELIYESGIAPEVVVHMDRRKFEQIIYNLISNAFKYTPEGGKVKVVSTQLSSREILISIVDSGAGINKEHHSLIFDRYYQTPDNAFKEKEGFGIGLALVRELTNLHGGEISVESKLGEGSTFNLKLPLNIDKETDDQPEKDITPSKVDMSYEPNSPDEKTFFSSQNGEVESTSVVMIVDDHPEVRAYISEIVKRRYSVIEAKNGSHALNILNTRTVDAIVTDLMMPWLDGFELIETLKGDEVLQKIPVMVVSARTTEEDKLRVLNSGVNDFMSKPFDPDKLIKRIENLLGGKEIEKSQWENLLSSKDDLEQDIISRINSLIIKRINDSNLTVKDLGNEICASERKTYRLIKDLTGHTPLDYIKLIRFDYAKNLIDLRKVKTASEAAKAIGMNNVTQFSKQYKKHYGAFPTEAG